MIKRNAIRRSSGKSKKICRLRKRPDNATLNSNGHNRLSRGASANRRLHATPNAARNSAHSKPNRNVNVSNKPHRIVNAVLNNNERKRLSAARNSRRPKRRNGAPNNKPLKRRCDGHNSKLLKRLNGERNSQLR